MSIATWVGSSAVSAASLAPRLWTGVGAAPAQIIGNAIDGQPWQLFLGVWDPNFPITGFDIRVVATDLTVIQDWLPVVGDTDVTLTGVVGKTLVLYVRATGPGGITVVQSADFGPVLAAGDELIAAFAFLPSSQDMSGLAVPWTPVVGDASANRFPIVNPNYPSLRYGFEGSFTSAVAQGLGANYANLRGKLGSDFNLNGTVLRFAIELPEANVTYRIYCGARSGTSTATPSLAIRETNDVGTVLFNSASNTTPPRAGSVWGSVGINQITDIKGNIYGDNSDWPAAQDAFMGVSPAGGDFIEITPSQTRIVLTRSAITPHLNCFAIYRKV